MSDEKQKSLSNTLLQIEKQFGKGAVMRLGDETTRLRARGHLDRLDVGGFSIRV